jgi:methyltransferase (TIGR00027 family)
MIVRARFVDEALERAVAGGAKQLLVLGAGFDSHACRSASLLAGLRVFEVDAPATQAFKRERVRAVVGAAPANLTYVPVDFEREGLRDVLSRYGYDSSATTFVIMEGLTMYLTEPALRETFGLIARHPAGSTVVFDFVSSTMIQMIRSIDLRLLPAPMRAFAERFLYLTRDEPWLFGIPARGERDYIESFGFEVSEILIIGSEAAARRYLTRSDGSRVGAGASVTESSSPRARAQAEAMAYRIAEAVVPLRH